MSRKLSWISLSLNLLQFHEIKQRNLGKAINGRPAGSRDGWSIRDTAKYHNISLGKCHNLLNVAKAIKQNPIISHATSFNAAIKLAKDQLK